MGGVPYGFLCWLERARIVAASLSFVILFQYKRFLGADVRSLASLSASTHSHALHSYVSSSCRQTFGERVVAHLLKHLAPLLHLLSFLGSLFFREHLHPIPQRIAVATSGCRSADSMRVNRNYLSLTPHSICTWRRGATSSAHARLGYSQTHTQQHRQPHKASPRRQLSAAIKASVHPGTLCATAVAKLQVWGNLEWVHACWDDQKYSGEVHRTPIVSSTLGFGLCCRFPNKAHVSSERGIKIKLHK